MTRNVQSRGSQIGIGGAVTGHNERLIDIFAVLRPQPAPIRSVREDLSWQDRGLCAEIGDDFWFPEKGGSTREAKAVCRACEVRAECLEYALDHQERWGIWGGKSERERHRLARERQSTIPQPQKKVALCESSSPPAPSPPSCGW